MSAAYFEDHPTDPNKVILRKRPCPFCQDKQRAWQGLTAAEFRKAVDGLEDLEDCWVALEHALKEKNT